MKTILFATDYSGTANNALQYAVKLAGFLKAKLVLFHAYNLAAPVTEVPGVVSIAIDELARENKESIKKLENKVARQTRGRIKVESLLGMGLPVDEILKAIRKTKADLVITGIKDTGKLSEALIGSTATSLMQKTKVPVLVVPPKSRFHESHKIVLAYDYQKTLGKTILKTIRDFAQLFKAEVEVVHVVRFDEEPGPSAANKMVKLRTALKGIKHNFYFPVSQNVPDEIHAFVRKQKAGMLVMLPHKHALLEKLFKSGNTRQVAFHTNIPLLSLHD